MNLCSSSDWYSLFAEVKRRGQFESDAQLAESLGLTRAQISAWRTGKSDLGTLTKLKLLDALGVDSLRSALYSLYPVRDREQCIRRQARLVERVGQRACDAAPIIAAAPYSNDGPSLSGNAILAALSKKEHAYFVPHLASVLLERGQLLCSTGDKHCVYFPTTAVISLHFPRETETDDGEEVATVGYEGFIGWGLMDNLLAKRSIVTCEGHAWRLSSHLFRGALARDGALRSAYFEFTRTVAMQLSPMTSMGSSAGLNVSAD